MSSSRRSDPTDPSPTARRRLRSTADRSVRWTLPSEVGGAPQSPHGPQAEQKNGPTLPGASPPMRMTHHGLRLRAGPNTRLLDRAAVHGRENSALERLTRQAGQSSGPQPNHPSVTRGWADLKDAGRRLRRWPCGPSLTSAHPRVRPRSWSGHSHGWLPTEDWPSITRNCPKPARHSFTWQ